VALYAINKADRAVKRAILISPLMQSAEKAEAAYRSRFGRSLREELSRAEEHVANDEGSQLLDVPGFLTCPKGKVTAGAFANYYGANPKFETKNLLPSLKIPSLVVVGELDPAASELRDVPKSVIFASIPGADADFRDDATEDLAKRMREFITSKPQG
jgi:pimeloyl-ACP methyl ester carboxylesterase